MAKSVTAEVLLEHAGFVRALARSLVADRDDASDLAQDTFVAALDRPPPRADNVRGWLRTVVRNLANRRWRDEQRRAGHEGSAGAEAERRRRVEAADERAARLELQRRVIDAVLALPVVYRDAIVARYLDELGPNEIAVREGVPVETVRTRLKRALAHLRESLDDVHGGDRRVWCVALLPLVRVNGRAGADGLLGGVGIVSTKSKLAAVVVVLVGLLGAAWLVWMSEARLAQPRSGPRTAVARTEDRAGQVPPGVDRVIADAAETPKVVESSALHWLTGTVMETDGSGIGGARVDARLVDGDTHSVVYADDAGRYSLESLTAGATAVSVARPESSLATDVGVFRIPVIEKLDIVLAPAAVLVGRVTDEETGQPLEGVQISVAQRWGPEASRAAARTDADGYYRIDGLPRGRIAMVEAEKEGWLSTLPAIQPGFHLDIGGREPTRYDLTMGRAARVVGTVRGPDGPIVGALVDVAHRRGVRVQTDADGRFVISGIPSGQVQVTARARGYDDPQGPGRPTVRRVTVPALGDVRVDIEMCLAGRLEGHVVTPEGGGIEDATISFVQQALPSSVRTNREGFFSVEGFVPDLVFGLTVSKPGFVETGEVRTIPADRAPEHLRIVLARAPVVTGQVRVPSGARLRGGYVRVFVVTEEPRGQRALRSSPRFPVLDDGSYRAEIPWAGEVFRVVAASAELPEIASPDTPLVAGRSEYRVDVMMQEGHTLRGQVIDRRSHRPIPRALVQIGSAVVATTDNNGQFVIEHALESPWGPGANGPCFPIAIQAVGYQPVSACPPLASRESIVIEMDPTD